MGTTVYLIQQQLEEIEEVEEEMEGAWWVILDDMTQHNIIRTLSLSLMVAPAVRVDGYVLLYVVPLQSLQCTKTNWKVTGSSYDKKEVVNDTFQGFLKTFIYKKKSSGMLAVPVVLALLA